MNDIYPAGTLLLVSDEGEQIEVTVDSYDEEFDTHVCTDMRGDSLHVFRHDILERMS